MDWHKDKQINETKQCPEIDPNIYEQLISTKPQDNSVEKELFNKHYTYIHRQKEKSICKKRTSTHTWYYIQKLSENGS